MWTTETSIESLAKWLSVHLRTKWLWVRVPLQSLKYFIKILKQINHAVTHGKIDLKYLGNNL